MKPLVLIGPGGHCRSCIDVIESTEQYRIEAIVGQESERGGEVMGYSINHVDQDLPALVEEFGNFLITIGQIKSNALRVKLFEQIKQLGGTLPSIVSPLAHVSRTASLGEGTIVMHMAIVNADASVGSNCIVNSRSLIEHDVQVGNHCHVSTGAIVNGGVTIGDDCFVGSGAVTMHGIQIESGSIIGAAAWVDENGRATRRR